MATRPRTNHLKKGKRTVKYIAALLLIAPLSISHAQMSPALEDSLANIPNSGQRTAALRSYARTSDAETLRTIMRVARTIPNSTDKSRLLETLAPRYLAGDSTLARVYFRVVRTVPSSEELSDLLISIVPYAVKSDQIANAIIETSRVVPSSAQRSDVLTALVESGAVRSNAVRENFAEATQDLPGENDRRQVMRAASRH